MTHKHQNHSSANTSINKNKLPSVYSKVTFERKGKVLDYGCGKYIDHIKAKVESQGCEYIPYDPFNLPYVFKGYDYEYGVCSNVLNVIDDMHEIENVILEITKFCKTSYFTVYEGDKSGIGRETMEDCYQRNEPLKTYLEVFKRLNLEPKVKRGVIIVEQ